MGGSKSLDPGAILADLVVSAIIGGMSSANDKGGGGAVSSGQSNAEAEAQRLAEEREAKSRRAEDRRAEEAVLKAQSQKQKLSQSGQTAAPASTLGATLGETGSLAGQSMHGSALIAAPQLKEKLGQ